MLSSGLNNHRANRKWYFRAAEYLHMTVNGEKCNIRLMSEQLSILKRIKHSFEFHIINHKGMQLININMKYIGVIMTS